MKTKLSDYSNEEIYAELQRRQVDDEIYRIKTLDINGITVKDFVVEIGDSNGYKKGEQHYEPFFSFYIKHGKKEHCIYYGHSPHKLWWPFVKDDYSDYDKENGAMRFIPKKFCEAMENVYEYHGKTIEEGIEYLKKCGFETISWE